MTHFLILWTVSEDSRIWTFSVAVSVGFVTLIAAVVWRYLATRPSGTGRKKDTP
jgi:hypothetical protein